MFRWWCELWKVAVFSSPISLVPAEWSTSQKHRCQDRYEGVDTLEAPENALLPSGKLMRRRLGRLLKEGASLCSPEDRVRRQAGPGPD